ncbi:hypothetical protein [Planobispora rosea]|uniref:hypothetical protein n=1 Tax=Planobispora rosea TaxID=35762 RepID=UPI00083ADF0E|nr:hypothetical protein [Planobispora rosea]
MDWDSTAELIGCDDPAQVDAGFERGERRVGVAVIGLALSVLDPDLVAPRLHRAMTDADAETRRCGVLAMGHMARLNGVVDGRSLDLLRALLSDPDPDVRGQASDAAGDVWIFVRRSRLPLWLRRRERLADTGAKLDLLRWWVLERGREDRKGPHRPASS